jgi:hypothetical protein
MTFLVVSLLCLAAFIAAWVVVGQLVPFWQAQPTVTSRGVDPGIVSGLSLWAVVQNLSALVGIASFLIQIVQWRRSV